MGFNDTQNTLSHPGLTSKFTKIKDKFGIEWSKVEWKDLTKPLYSALAARLFMSNKPSAIPDDIEGQAKYWKDNYNTDAGKGTWEKFKEDVESREIGT